jgi:hypothetical protein
MKNICVFTISFIWAAIGFLAGRYLGQGHSVNTALFYGYGIFVGSVSMGYSYRLVGVIEKLFLKISQPRVSVSHEKLCKRCGVKWEE